MTCQHTEHNIAQTFDDPLDELLALEFPGWLMCGMFSHQQFCRQNCKRIASSRVPAQQFAVFRLNKEVFWKLAALPQQPQRILFGDQ